MDHFFSLCGETPTPSLHFCVNLIVKKAQHFIMVAWKVTSANINLQDFPPSTLIIVSDFFCPILLRSGSESLSDTNLVVSYKPGKVDTIRM